MEAAADYQYAPLRIPPGTSRSAAATMLSLQADTGGWELARLQLHADGTRKVILRRRARLSYLPLPVICRDRPLTGRSPVLSASAPAAPARPGASSTSPRAASHLRPGEEQARGSGRRRGRRRRAGRRRAGRPRRGRRRAGRRRSGRRRAGSRPRRRVRRRSRPIRSAPRRSGPAPARGPASLTRASSSPTSRAVRGDVERRQLVRRPPRSAARSRARRPDLLVQRAAAGSVSASARYQSISCSCRITGRTANCAAASSGASRQVRPPKVTWVSCWPGAEAVEHLAAREARARAARRGCRSGSRRAGSGRAAPAGLSIAKSAERGERRARTQQQPGAARAVRPQVRRGSASAQGTSTTLPTVLRSASFASACGAWSSGSVSPDQRVDVRPPRPAGPARSCTCPKIAGSYFRYRPQCRPTTL